MIYFFQNTANDLIKIGVSTDIPRRQHQIQEQEGSPIRVLGVMEGDERKERELHKRFADVCYGGEWFVPGPLIFGFIDSHCDSYSEEHHNGPDGYQKRNGEYIPGPGRDSFEKTHGSKPQSFRLLLTTEQHAHILTRAAELNISAAEYIRRLIDADTSDIPAV